MELCIVFVRLFIIFGRKNVRVFVLLICSRVNLFIKNNFLIDFFKDICGIE